MNKINDESPGGQQHASVSCRSTYLQSSIILARDDLTPRTDLDGSWRAILLLALNKLAFTSMGLWVFVLRRTVNIFFEACQ